MLRFSRFLAILASTLMCICFLALPARSQSLEDAVNPDERTKETVIKKHAPVPLDNCLPFTSSDTPSVRPWDEKYPNASREERIEYLMRQVQILENYVNQLMAGFSQIPDPFLERLVVTIREQIYILLEQLNQVPPPVCQPPEIKPPLLTPPEIKPPTPGVTPKTPTTASGTPAPPPGENPENDKEMAEQGQKLIDALRKKGAMPGVGRHDNPAMRAIPGFPPWFTELQDLLLGRNQWKDIEEEARQLLGKYANAWAKAKLPQPTHSSLPYFFQFLGCNESNNKAIENYNWRLPRSANFGGVENSKDWCAWATNKSYVDPIQQAGYSLAGGGAAWSLNKKYNPTYYTGNPQANIETGDFVSTKEHVLTCLEVRGDKVLCISGNAGGGPIAYSGTVRIEEIPLSKIEIVKNHMSVDTIRAHENDKDWMQAHGITKKL